MHAERVEKAEDPEVILKEAQESMTRELEKAKEQAVQAIAARNLKAFDRAFWGHIGHIVRNLSRSIVLSLTSDEFLALLSENVELSGVFLVFMVLAALIVGAAMLMRVPTGMAGTGLVCGKTARAVLGLAGIQDAWVYTRGQTRTSTNYAKAIFNALQSVPEVKMTPAQRGRIQVVSGAQRMQAPRAEAAPANDAAGVTPEVKA